MLLQLLAAGVFCVSAAMMASDSGRAADVGVLDAAVQKIIEKGKQGCSADLDAYCSTVTPGEGRLAFCLIAHADKRSLACESALAVARSEAEVLINTVDAAVAACAPDIATLCAGTEPGEGRIAQCLADNKPSLSAKCGEVLDVVGKVVFAPGNAVAAAAPASPEPAAEAQSAPAPAETVTPAQPPPPPPPAATPILDALDAKVQAIVEKGKQGCSADLETYCSGVTPGEGRLAFCLIAHADKRSPACESALAVARSEAEVLINTVETAVAACAPDIATLCAGTEPGEGRIAQCLADNKPSLSAKCGEVLDVVGKVVFAPGNAVAAAAPASPEPAAASPSAVTPDATGGAGTDTCQWLEASVSDWGKDATTRDARKLLDARVSKFAARQGLKDFKPAKVSVKCSVNWDLGVEANYTCRALAQVCWDAAAATAGTPSTAPANDR